MLLATACTHHHSVTTLRPNEVSIDATARLDNDREVNVRAVPTPDGARWIERAGTSDDPRPGPVIDSADMRSYTTVSHGRGALEGLAIGGLGGAVLGAGLGFAAGDDHCTSNSFCILQFSAEDKAVLAGIVWGSIGLGLGALIGVAIGSRDVYEVDTGFVPRVSASVAPGRAGGALTWSF